MLDALPPPQAEALATFARVVGREIAAHDIRLTTLAAKVEIMLAKVDALAARVDSLAADLRDDRARGPNHGTLESILVAAMRRAGT